MRKMMVVICTALVLLAGCGKDEEVPKLLNVNLTVEPTNGERNEPVTFQAKVTYGDEAVKDADDVSFEIWLANSEDHEKVAAIHKENGIYEMEKSFDEEGTYYVYAHVTARDMHNMPKKEFVIGKPSSPEENGGSKSMDEMNHEKSDQ
ncbi:FixH family protein [Peribacillus sp. NPDC097295]|uniref:FixH family protein n=1 Tax=Peribacillus sp. NPDC097295 TaxID=3364402 RepID=UPI00382DFB65